MSPLIDQTGIVFNIQRFSIHDGPGIRTTVFLKGCSLHCFWCHNPEGIHLQPEIQFYPERCIGDESCAQVCKRGAHLFQDNLHSFLRDRCDTCGECVDVCYTNALEQAGHTSTAGQVLEEVLRDRAFYTRSGGGVTLSGGDPLVQRGFTRAILELCHENGIRAAIETAANCAWEHLAELLPLVELVMMDLKVMDAERHRQCTGVSNQRILANACRLVEHGQPVIFRTPVIPGVNDSVEEIRAIAGFVRERVATWTQRGFDPALAPTLELLPFHQLAENKYHSLGVDDHVRDLQPPTREHMDILTRAACETGITASHR